MIHAHLHFKAMIYAEAGRKEKARQILHRAEKLSTQASLQDNGVPIASAYAALGDKDRAFVWLERAYMVRSPDLITLKMPENLGPLRTDRRFANLLKRVGLP